ncbi:GntR family transcriptional regulator [Mucilaginibacter sp. RS28]|uniref:GntR family transcriptional regulator n=1 Tax=Mucilaginibacter straminoryzae TaxID=2932774 RepID=A0A9X2B8A2_9SPHI|nr:substrate-binding domain-containing protein [Mucilaginibacter straminoryzae]MCJ8209266.1 GntR family transcriptional regulator [Mucilaginibacter straminoryzae]
MKSESFFDFVVVDEYAATPKYLQLSNSILNAIEAEKLTKNFLLPSINELSYQLDISRDTAEKSYRYLKEIGVISSVPGKGYFITNVNFRQKLKIFLLFNKLSAHKKIVYDTFVSTLGEDAAVDFYIYNNDFKLFKKLLLNRRDDYSHYVIIPHIASADENEQNVIDLLNNIPKDKLILLDKRVPGLKGGYGAVYENFEKDIYNALDHARSHLSSYHTIKLIFPAKSYYPVEIIKGFQLFCRQYAFNHEVLNDIKSAPINKGEVFINLMEDDLVTLLERLTTMNFKVGEDVGVISYNETPLKKILLNGITTVSTDFKFMGSTAAELILSNSRQQVENPFYYIQRASL